jgi:hypothetical protein
MSSDASLAELSSAEEYTAFVASMAGTRESKSVARAALVVS